jgi:hypothetical protein
MSRDPRLYLDDLCQSHVTDPYAQRYHFWKAYAERYLA